MKKETTVIETNGRQYLCDSGKEKHCLNKNLIHKLYNCNNKRDDLITWNREKRDFCC
jgi:hypothetical protein